MHISLPYEKGAPRALSSEVEGRLAKMIHIDELGECGYIPNWELWNQADVKGYSGQK